MKLAVVGRVTETRPIEGADRIHQAFVSCGEEGLWSGVVGKDISAGDSVVAFLQDAVLQPGPRWSFMEKHKWRVRMARFKGVPSECVIVPAGEDELAMPPGTDLTEVLGVKKHEKPVPAAIAGDVRGNFPSFIPKTDEENFQRVRNLEEMMTGWDWVATVKYDGTSCTVWNDDEGMHVCSRNLELKEFTESGKGNVYWQAARKYGLERIPRGFALQFEVCGPGIQGNPLGLSELAIAAFTLHHIRGDGLGRAHFGTLVHMSMEFDIPLAEIVATGHGYADPDTLRMLADEARYPNGEQAEGVVVRSISSNWSVKSISLNYKDA
jgi:RNA ligase (TIGR02306 family)